MDRRASLAGSSRGAPAPPARLRAFRARGPAAAARTAAHASFAVAREASEAEAATVSGRTVHADRQRAPPMATIVDPTARFRVRLATDLTELRQVAELRAEW